MIILFRDIKGRTVRTIGITKKGYVYGSYWVSILDGGDGDKKRGKIKANAEFNAKTNWHEHINEYGATRADLFFHNLCL